MTSAVHTAREMRAGESRKCLEAGSMIECGRDIGEGVGMTTVQPQGKSRRAELRSARRGRGSIYRESERAMDGEKLRRCEGVGGYIIGLRGNNERTGGRGSTHLGYTTVPHSQGPTRHDHCSFSPTPGPHVWPLRHLNFSPEVTNGKYLEHLPSQLHALH